MRMLNFKKDILLSEHTTISAGGKAKKFISCEDEETIIEVLNYSKNEKEKLQVISGGSNVIFQDKGYDGIVMKINIKGIEFKNAGENEIVTVKAGENWDEFVLNCINRGLQGIECMSGIPGFVGAAPVQNVGAYGQEVKDVIVNVKAVDRESLVIKYFTKEECIFSYRQSRFKNNDKDKYVITEVSFILKRNKSPEIKYPELEKYINENTAYNLAGTVQEKLMIARNSVLVLRRKKSMVIDDKDPNTKSCGSFFMNPVLNEKEFKELKLKISEFPFYKNGEEYKIPAAWLIENSGFKKGFRINGAGISENHSLAIINCGGKTSDILALAEKIEKGVKSNFGIKLIREPVVVD